MARSARVQLNNPSLLRWARETAGYSVQDVAKRLGKDPADILRWERGEQAPTYRQLQELAAYVRRPVAALFLPEPPEKPGPPDDYRLLRDDEEGDFGPQALLAFREMRNSLRDLQELSHELGAPIRLSLDEWSLSTPPATCASALRSSLDVSMDTQASWSDAYTALNQWREVLFEQGVLVQFFSVQVGEFRGFSIIEAGLGGIGISSKDAPAARVFSLFHEVGHLCLRKPGVSGDVPSPGSADTSQAARVEQYCNRFAGAFLLPFEEETVRAERESVARDFGRETAEACGRRFHVSKYVVALRLLNLEMIDEETCWREWLSWQKEDKRMSRAEGGGGNYYGARLSRLGRPFISTVLDAMDQGVLTAVSAARMLRMKPHQLERIREKLVT